MNEQFMIIVNSKKVCLKPQLKQFLLKKEGFVRQNRSERFRRMCATLPAENKRRCDGNCKNITKVSSSFQEDHHFKMRITSTVFCIKLKRTTKKITLNSFGLDVNLNVLMIVGVTVRAVNFQAVRTIFAVRMIVRTRRTVLAQWKVPVFGRGRKKRVKDNLTVNSNRIEGRTEGYLHRMMERSPVEVSGD
jgi:hypothetical protein